ncbi:MAG: ABC transporter permease subunit [Thermoleophilia bacterium]|nr:ABC transporter permease subunit [Thermoleophilia bacterium]
MDSLIAELLLLRKRVGNWVLLGFWLFMAILFSYLLPYYAYTSDLNFHGRGVGAVLLIALLPQNLVANITNSFPFFGGTMVLIMGALAMGSEYNWGTLTPAFTQRAGRLKVFFAKMLALAIALVPFVLLVFLLAFLASVSISWREGQPIELPPLWDLLRALAAGWFLLAVWAAFGVFLAVLSRGTALAIGLGIIYGLVIEGIISSFGRQIDLLKQISTVLLRTNGYSLISSLGVTLPSEAGPGGFSGDSVSGTQAALVLAGCLIVFIAISAAVIRRRDVTGAS